MINVNSCNRGQIECQEDLASSWMEWLKGFEQNSASDLLSVLEVEGILD